MKSSAKTAYETNQEFFEDQNMLADTNPFQRSAAAVMQKPGKRPRIMKPVYSVRLAQ
ncbi:hypothetical protein [Dyadobacter sp.]|uniref:hypothetical protein n=1 Tax=Dyadobacter sp. TaxID=1914288 RepID=UPI003F6FEB35